MKLNLMKSGSAQGAKTLVAFASSSRTGKDKKEEVAKINHTKLNQRLSAAISDSTISGKAQSATLFRDIDFEGHRNVLVVGIGTSLDGEGARKLGAEIKKALTSAKIEEAMIDFDGITTAKTGAPLLQAFVEGAMLAAYDFSELKSKSKESAKTTTKKAVDSDKKELTLHIASKLATDAGAKRPSVKL